MEEVLSHYIQWYSEGIGAPISAIPTHLCTVNTVHLLDEHLIQTFGKSLLFFTFHQRLSLRQWFYDHMKQSTNPHRMTMENISQFIVETSCQDGEEKLLRRVYEIQRKTEKENTCGIDVNDFIQTLELRFTPFVIISASYNNEQYISQYAQRILVQRYVLYRVLYFDDASSDQTLSKIKNTVRDYPLKWKIQSHSERKFQAYAKYQCYTQTYDDEVCVFVDGDDHLNNVRVFEILDEVYRTTKTPLTWGSYCVHFNSEIIYLPNTIQPYDQPVTTKCKTQTRKERKWMHSHLRTGLAKLFKTIPLSHIQDQDGQWLTFATDVAEMYWALDQCPFHIRIHNVLLNYNKSNSIKYTNSYYNNHSSEEREEVMEFIKNAQPASDIIPRNTASASTASASTSSSTSVSTSTSTLLPTTLSKTTTMSETSKAHTLSTPELLSPVFIINLKRRRDRKQKMRAIMTSLHIEPTFFEATDGYTDAMSLIYQKYEAYWNDRNAPKKYISKGALGLLCTYIRLLHHALTNRFTHVCIFEDDIIIHKHFQKNIQKVNEIKQTFDIVYLGANQQCWDDIHIFHGLPYYEINAKRKSWTYGMFGVILNRRAMKKIYKYLVQRDVYTHEYPIDCIMNQLVFQTSLRACVLFPNVVIADLTDSDMRKSRDMIKWSKILRWKLNDYNMDSEKDKECAQHTTNAYC